MTRKLGMLILVSILLLVVGCAKSAPPAQITDTQAEDVPVVTDVQEEQKEAPQEAEKEVIPDDVVEIIKKSEKVKSIYYKYSGPETGTDLYEFFVKGLNIKYEPARKTKSLDMPEAYDSIFISKEAKTAMSYCADATCKYPGKKEDLSYDEEYILTPFDWLNSIKNATKVSEQRIDNRNTWKISTNAGMVWIDTFYGVPLQVEANGNAYNFQHMTFNSVPDSEVIPN